jgi:hypothetical protein
MQDNVQTTNSVTVEEISHWYVEVRDDLTADDPTGSRVVRWDQGGTTDLSDDPHKKAVFLSSRTARLTEFLAELHD